MKKIAAKPNRSAKPRLTDPDRHKRFVEMAHEAEVDERPESFDHAFATVTAAQKAGKQDDS